MNIVQKKMVDLQPRVKGWVDGVPLDQGTIQQAEATSRLQYVFKHVALMPDAHVGIGATVGSVVPLKGAVVPAAVGVDIGCGMMAVKLSGINAAGMDASDLKRAREAIENAMPVGRNAHDKNRIPKVAYEEWKVLSEHIGFHQAQLFIAGKQSPIQQLGTMGGGNHFFEICLDENDETWIMLHSGSRGIGNRIGRHFIGLAKEECAKWGIKLPHSDLAYLPEGTPGFDEYMQTVLWAQDYAARNRVVMWWLARDALFKLGGPWELIKGPGEQIVSCHHNYIAREHHFGENILVTRKGAVRAREGDMGIIPGSMGARSYIVRGKGNPMSFHSCSHGAGRVMSRSKAKELFTEDDLRKATEGIECRKDIGVIDETPQAYKNIDDVMAAQSELVEVVHTLRQIVNIKG